MAEEPRQPWSVILIVLMIIGFAVTNWIVVKAWDSRFDEVNAKIDSVSSDLSKGLMAIQHDRGARERVAASAPAPAPAPADADAAAAAAPTPTPAPADAAAAAAPTAVATPAEPAPAPAPAQ